jgi:O-methyltransferase
MNQSISRFIKRTAYSAIRATKELPPQVPELRHAPVLPRFATYSPWLTDAPFNATMQAVRQHTLVDRLRCYELWSLVQQSAKLNRGSLIEVGVWRGGTGCLIAEAARISGVSEPIYLCDTFSGVVNAGDMDTRYKGGEHSDTSADTVKQLAQSMNLTSVQVLQGIFPTATGDSVGDAFRFVHLDLDVYESTRQSLDFLWPRLVVGGIVVFDDYGTHGCEGVTRLVNETSIRGDCTFIHNANGHGILIKTA